MVSIVYGLCAMTALLSAVLLIRGYVRTRSKVLLWSGLCFCGLMLSNVLLVLDKLVFPGTDLALWRQGITLVSLSMLLYGLIYAND